MSKILISGCGISFSGERPTWVKVLKICGCDIIDLTGPAISNQLILNFLIKEISKTKNISHVICQLTSKKKLDVELSEKNRDIYMTDSLRNFTHKGFWPSSISEEHKSKKIYYEYLYSPTLEEEDTVIKCILLQKLCKEKNIKLLFLFGYELNWSTDLKNELNIDDSFIISNDYKKSKYYSQHDFTNRNTVPNKNYQIFLAEKINKDFLKSNIEKKLSKFYG